MYRVSRDWAEVPPEFRDRTRNDRRVPNVRIFLIVRSVFIILRYFILLFYTVFSSIFDSIFGSVLDSCITLVTGFLYQRHARSRSRGR